MIPNKITYLIFTCIWVCVFLISSTCLLFKTYKTKSINMVSVLILLTYLAILVYCIVRYIYWMLKSEYGRSWLGFELPLILIETTILLLYLIIISLVAHGYKVVNENLTWAALVKNIVIILIFVVTSLLMQYTNFFLMIFMVVEIIALVLLLKMDINKTISIINEAINNVDLNDRRSYIILADLRFKRTYFRTFKLYVYIYWTLEGTVQCLRPFLGLYHEWIFTLVHHILTLVSMSFLFITLNYSVKRYDYGREIEPVLNMPLPFDPSRDPKICGELIIIQSVWDSRSIYSVGVETSKNGSSLKCPETKGTAICKRAEKYLIESSNLDTNMEVHTRSPCQKYSKFWIEEFKSFDNDHFKAKLTEANDRGRIKHDLEEQYPCEDESEESKDCKQFPQKSPFFGPNESKPWHNSSLFQAEKVYNFKRKIKRSRLRRLDRTWIIQKPETSLFQSFQKQSIDIEVCNNMEPNIGNSKIGSEHVKCNHSNSTIDIEQIIIEM